MSQEIASKPDVVLVKCLGIACPTGFHLSPVGYDPMHVEFLPGKATPLPKPYADYLMAQDSARFSIEKAKHEDKQDQEAAPKRGGLFSRK